MSEAQYKREAASKRAVMAANVIKFGILPGLIMVGANFYIKSGFKFTNINSDLIVTSVGIFFLFLLFGIILANRRL